LATIHGPLLLNGEGELGSKVLHFNEQALAVFDHQESLKVL
jgi:hypothetical protein